MKKIGIVILHFRGLENTRDCVKSVLNLDPARDLDVSLLVVDNASEEPYKNSIGKVEVIRNRENTGFTGGMNTGIKRFLDLDYDYILTVNNDTIFDKGFLKHANDYLKKEDNVGIFSPKIYFYPGTEYHYDRYKVSERGKVLWFAGGKLDRKNFLPSHRGVDEVDSGQYDEEKTMDFATGCCMIFSRETLREVGVFDDKYFLYYEDVDLSLRMRRAHKKLLFMPKAFIWHKNAKSAGGAGSELQDYYTTRNRLLLGSHFAAARTRVALLKEGFSLILRGRKWQKNGSQDFFLRRFGKGSFPI